MQLKNSTERFGFIAQLFHWVIVVLIVTQYVLAEMAEDLPLSIQKISLIANHKSIGITILALALLRIIWRFWTPPPSLPNNLKPWERVLANVTHWGLYLLIFALPISGWLMSSAANFSVSYFSLFTLPDFIGPDKDTKVLLEDVHGALAGTLFVLAILHIAAVVKHHFFLKDNVLRRMVPGWRNQPIGE